MSLTYKRKRAERPKVRIRIKKKRDPEFLNQIQVPTNNRFATLANDDTAMQTDQIQMEKKSYIAPIVITDHETDIQKIFEELKVECNTKITSVGRKIFPATTEHKVKIIESFKIKKIGFFSHPENNNKSFKVILSGLPEIKVEHIKASVHEQLKVLPTNIVMFNTKSTNKLYLLHFNATEANLKTLQEIKYICHHVIKWLPYTPKRSGPTQCYRCLMYGHGASQCNRFTACMLCAGTHITKECTTHVNNDNAIYKCFNCWSAKVKDNHKANDAKCPFREKYEEARDNARNKSKAKQKTQQKSFQNTSPVLQTQQQSSDRPTYADQARAAAAATSRSSISHERHRRASIMSTNSVNVNNNLWSMAECTNLLFKSIEKLQKCNSKLEQLQAIAELLQHACT